MILVDVEVPAIWQVFDFELDENASVKEVIPRTQTAHVLFYSCQANQENEYFSLQSLYRKYHIFRI